MRLLYTILFSSVCFLLFSQETDDKRLRNEISDSLYIEEVENQKNMRPKVLHAEPLYIDLIRDLGARKGEKEWNVGLGIIDRNEYDEYEALVEYEWAPIDRLGLEIELPFNIILNDRGAGSSESSRLNGLKLAAQYSFFVSEKLSTTLAIGYLNEFEFAPFNEYKSSQFIQGNVYNPFFIAAKRWGTNYHTLIYTGPELFHHFRDNSLNMLWQVNSNFHYMISGTRNFLGVEFNKEISKEEGFEMTMRPQMRVGITDNILIGIVAGIPVNRKNERFSTFLRVIYEPGHNLSQKNKR